MGTKEDIAREKKVVKELGKKIDAAEKQRNSAERAIKEVANHVHGTSGTSGSGGLLDFFP